MKELQECKTAICELPEMHNEEENNERKDQFSVAVGSHTGLIAKGSGAKAGSSDPCEYLFKERVG